MMIHAWCKRYDAFVRRACPEFCGKLPWATVLLNGSIGRTPAVESIRCPNRSKSKKEDKTKPEAQMRLGFRSFVLPVHSKENDRTGNALRSTLHHSPVSPHDRRACPPDLAPPISRKPRQDHPVHHPHLDKTLLQPNLPRHRYPQTLR